MPVFVKAHRRAGSIVKAYSRKSTLKTIKILNNQIISFRNQEGQKAYTHKRSRKFDDLREPYAMARDFLRAQIEVKKRAGAIMLGTYLNYQGKRRSLQREHRRK